MSKIMPDGDERHFHESREEDAETERLEAASLERELFSRYYVGTGGEVIDSALDTSATERDSELDECEIVDRLNKLEAERDALKERMLESFVQGAKWWEFKSSGGTMWASDREAAYKRATEIRDDGTLGKSDAERRAAREAEG